MIAKEREASSSASADWEVTDLLGTVLTSGQGNLGYTKSHERIVYTQGRDRYNACKHYKFEQDLDSKWYQWRQSDTPDNMWNRSCSPRSPMSHEAALSSVDANYSGLSSYDWGNFAQRAIEAMTPSMESGFSLANFLYEIRDIKTLLKWWDRGKTTFRNLSQGTLNYSFGLIPFIGDMKRIYEGLSTFNERLQRLKAGAGKLNVRHYSEETGEDEWSDQFSGTHWEARDQFTGHSIVYTASMTYTYQYPEIDRMQSAVYGLLDTLGLQLNAWIIWEAIPYSFVIDWFFNVGDFLNQYRKKWIPIELTIKDFGVSAKTKASWLREVRGIGKVDSPWTTLGKGKLSFYHRFPMKVEDRMFNISSDGSVTTRKFVLGSLLLEQRISPR